MYYIEKCNSAEIEKYKSTYSLELNWCSENPEENQCYKITENGNAIAMIEFGIKLYGYRCIDNFEVFNKRQGFGKSIIESLISSAKEKYCLYSKDEDSNSFWQAAGFVLRNDGFGTQMFYSK